MPKIINIPVGNQNVAITIPDPIPVLNGNVIGFTQADPSIVITNTTPPVVVPPVVTPPSSKSFTLDQLTGEVNGPGRGLNNWFSKQVFSYSPVSDNYYRLSWAQLQTGASTYDWTAFDNVIKALSPGQKLCFRIGAVDNSAIGGTVNLTGGKACYPAFLHTLMQSELVKDWSDGSTWYPNWNSNSFLTAWENFNIALAKHISDNGYGQMIFSIDFGGYGNYLAEWHMDGISEPAANKATDASMIRIMQAQLTAFPDFWHIMSISMFDTRYVGNAVASFAIAGKSNNGLFGLRSDHLGWFGTTSFDKSMDNRVVNGVNFATELKKRSQFAPCMGEPMNGTSGLTPSGGTPFQTLIDEVNYYGLSLISNESGITTAAALANFTKASAAAGYRIGILSGSVNGNVVTLNWNNSGVAPVYENWDVWLICGTQKIKSSFNLKTLLTTGVSTDSLPSGSYPLSIIITDPNGYRKPFPLMNKGRLVDGSYLLTTI